MHERRARTVPDPDRIRGRRSSSLGGAASVRLGRAHWRSNRTHAIISAVYAPDEDPRDLLREVTGPYSFFSVMHDIVVGDAPDDWSTEIRKAEVLKYEGRYSQAAEILTSLMMDADAIYSEVTDLLFEIEACGGLAKVAYQYLCSMIRKLNTTGLTYLVPPYRDRLKDFSRAFGSEESLHAYLKRLCGNDDYYLPMPYATLKAHFDDISQSELYAEYRV